MGVVNQMIDYHKQRPIILYQLVGGKCSISTYLALLLVCNQTVATFYKIRIHLGNYTLLARLKGQWERDRGGEIKKHWWWFSTKNGWETVWILQWNWDLARDMKTLFFPFSLIWDEYPSVVLLAWFFGFGFFWVFFFFFGVWKKSEL